MDEILRYSDDLAKIIRMARAENWTTREIVRVLSGSLPHSEAQKIAREAAPLLEISTKEFLALRKNA